MSTTKSTAAPAAAEKSSAPATASSIAIGPSQQFGNQYLQTLLQARMLQAKLTVNHPNDAFEEEADRVAGHVMRMPAPAPVAIQRRTTDDGVHRVGLVPDVPGVDDATENSIRSLAGRGSPLPDGVRAFMEPRFDADFSAVRVHHDAEAQGLARSVNAQAFTLGSNVVFGAGFYSPDTDAGRRLLAHELTHVVQQTGGAASETVRRTPHTKGAKAAPPKPATNDDDNEWAPQYLDDGSANEWAARGKELADALNKSEKEKTTFGFLVVTDGVYVYSPSGVRLAQFKIIAPVPISGLFIGGSLGNTVRLMVNKKGDVRLRPIGGYDPKSKTLIKDWSTMTDADQKKYFPADTMPMIIIPGHPSPKTDAKEDKKPPADVKLDPNARASTTATPGRGKGKAGDKPLDKAPSGFEFDEEKGKSANAPAFPAYIKASSTLIPQRGSNEFTMHLDWNYGETSLLGAVWNADTTVHYTWERWNVTRVPGFEPGQMQDAAKLKSQNARDESAAVDDQFISHSRQERLDKLLEEHNNSANVINMGGHEGDSPTERLHDVMVERDNQMLEIASVLTSAGGHLVETIDHWLTKPDNEVTLGWNEEGVFLVRCIAQPQEHSGRRNLPSVATAFVEVRSPEYIAKDTMAAADAMVDELKLLRERTTDPTKLKEIDKQITEIQIGAHGSAVDALELAVTRKKAEVEKAKGQARSRREDELESLEKELAIAKKNETHMAVEPNGTKRPHALRPEAAIASEVTGATFPLILQLVRLRHGDHPRWAIYDVSSKGDYLGYAYTGEGSTDGAAIERAFDRFAGANDYGRGTVVFHIPDEIENVASWQRNMVKRNVHVGDALAKDRLHDLVTVLTTLSIVIPGLGTAANLIGGALSIEHIIQRWQNGTLELDGALLADLVSIFSAAGTVAGKVSGLMMLRAEGEFVLALESGDIGQLTRALKRLKRASTLAQRIAVANEVIGYGGLVLGKVQLLRDIDGINEAEISGTMTHAQARSARARALLNSVQNDVLMLTGPLHEARRARERAATPRENMPPARATGTPEGVEPVPRSTAQAIGLPRESFVLTHDEPHHDADNEQTRIDLAPPVLPAIRYLGEVRPDGTREPDRIISRWNGEPVYVSSASSVTLRGQPGTPVVREPGRVYHFAGIQEAELHVRPYNRGWLIKHEARTNMAVIAELDNVVFHVEAESAVPEEINAWLAGNDAIPYIDIQHYMGWLDPDPENGGGGSGGGSGPTSPPSGGSPPSAPPSAPRRNRAGPPPIPRRNPGGGGGGGGGSNKKAQMSGPKADPRSGDAPAPRLRTVSGDIVPTPKLAPPPSGPTADPSPGEPSVTVAGGTVRAMFYQFVDGIRLVFVHEGKAYYQSTGRSQSLSATGEYSRKAAGEFYEFIGFQEHDIAPTPEGVVFTDREKYGIGWLIKATDVVSGQPVPQLHQLAFSIDAGLVASAAEANEWLRAQGYSPAVDYFRDFLHWE